MAARKIDHKTTSRLSAQQMRFLHEHNQCVLCGSPLKFKFEVKAQEKKLHEEAHCDECAVRVRRLTFSIQ